MTLKSSTLAAVGGRSGIAANGSAATAEDQIRALIEDRVKAVRAKDIIGAMSSSASDILSFDVVDPLQYVGLDALKKRLEGWYSSFQGPIGLEICELNITAGNDVAFSHSLNQVIGTKTDGKKIEMCWRATGCYRKVDGKWLVTHEHNSVPFEPASGKASLHLKP
jgi:ketosteroid isomerase-like protein